MQAAHNILILAGNGQGSFTVGLPSSTGLGEAQQRGEVGDFDGDGRDDIFHLSFFQFAQNEPGLDVQLARLGQASGGLADLGLAIDLTPRPFTSEGLTGDLDGDGVLDVVGQNASFLAWRRGVAESGSFEEPRTLGVAGEALLVADLDQDGLDEILSGTGSTGALRILDRLGSGQFALVNPTGLTLPVNTSELLANDLDGDGDLDIVATLSGSTFAWVPNLTGFAFGAPSSVDLLPSGFPIGPIVLGDFNADGLTDVVFGRFQIPFDQFTLWAEGLGGGAFGPAQDVDISTAQGIALDLNGDGFDDLVSIDSSIKWVAGGPDGLQTTGFQPLVAGTFPEILLGVADFDGDGREDLITASSSGAILGYRRSSSTQVAFDQSPTLVADAVSLPFGGTDFLPKLVDLGADGDLDVIAGQREIPAWFENVGNGPVGDAFCGPANPNSTGGPSRIFGVGSDAVLANDLTLRAAGLPTNAFGIFIVSQMSQPATPAFASSGLLCLAGEIGRYVAPDEVQSSGASGSFALDLDLSAIPQPQGFVAAQPGSTWHFQAWHRDSSPSGPTSNFTDGLMVTFE